MRKGAKISLGLICLLLAGWLAVRFAARSEKSRPLPSPANATSTAVPSVRRPEPPPRSPAPSAQNVAKPAQQQRSTEGEMSLVSLIQTHAGLYHQFLNLDGLELQRLTEIFVEFETKKSEIEAGKVRIRRFENGVLELEIPPYPEEGAALRRAFQARLQDAFPNGRFEQIDDYLGSFFDVYFRGFGITEQSYVISRNPAEPDRVVFKWSATVVGNRTPSGIQTPARWESSEGMGRVSLASLESGEFRFLEPIVRKAFYETESP